MDRLRWVVAGVAVVFVVAACGVDARDPSAPATRAALPSTPVQQPIGRAPRAVVVSRVELVAVDVASAEDGLGAIVDAPNDAIAIDVTASRWPGRALDPVLHAGQIRLRRYRHVSSSVLRFVIADRASLPRDEAVFVQWGDDALSRIDVAARLPEAP